MGEKHSEQISFILSKFGLKFNLVFDISSIINSSTYLLLKILTVFNGSPT